MWSRRRPPAAASMSPSAAAAWAVQESAAAPESAASTAWGSGPAGGVAAAPSAAGGRLAAAGGRGCLARDRRGTRLQGDERPAPSNCSTAGENSSALFREGEEEHRTKLGRKNRLAPVLPNLGLCSTVEKTPLHSFQGRKKTGHTGALYGRSMMAALVRHQPACPARTAFITGAGCSAAARS
eukprot:scaffold1204_cov51-Phaeocystis_antarctica.AAC.2